jgi:hypothetical protein
MNLARSGKDLTHPAKVSNRPHRRDRASHQAPMVKAATRVGTKKTKGRCVGPCMCEDSMRCITCAEVVALCLFRRWC